MDTYDEAWKNVRKVLPKNWVYLSDTNVALCSRKAYSFRRAYDAEAPISKVMVLMYDHQNDTWGFVGDPFLLSKKATEKIRDYVYAIVQGCKPPEIRGALGIASLA